MGSPVTIHPAPRNAPKRAGKRRSLTGVRFPESPFPIGNGASTRTLHRRAAYGGRKGRAAARRLRELERRLAIGRIYNPLLALGGWR